MFFIGIASVTEYSTRRLYAAAHGLDEAPLRFDVVSIDWTEGGRPQIRHDQGAFNVDGG